MDIEVISKENLPKYKHLMLSYIYDELQQYPDDLDCEYICLAHTAANADGIIFPVSVLICLMEPYGDVAVLSIYTMPEYRRQGYASALLDKAVFVARRLFQFEEGENEEDINLKAIYRLAPERESVFEAFLKKNNFVDFYLLDEDEEYKVWAAIAEIHFYRTPDDPGYVEKEDSEYTENDDPEYPGNEAPDEA